MKKAPYAFVNPLDLTDCYKIFHYQMYPKNMTYLYSNFTPRSNKHMNLPRLNDGFDDCIVNFGLQGFIKQHLIETWNYGFFNQNADEIITDYTTKIQKRYSRSLLTEHIDNLYELHELQYLPLQICGLPEGSVVPIRIPIMTAESTDERFAWLVNYLETIDCSQLWKPITSATTAFWYRRVFTRFSKLTGGNEAMIDYLGHDFSFRGMSGVYDAAVSGAAHLLSFNGTDNIPGVDYMEEYYNDGNLYFENIAPPATEHSVMCAGTKEGEFNTIKRLITEVIPDGIVSIVADTWDYWNTINNHARELKDAIMQRDGKVVWRPDSGNPIDVICGIHNNKVYDLTDTDELCDVLDEISRIGHNGPIQFDKLEKIFKPYVLDMIQTDMRVKNITIDKYFNNFLSFATVQNISFICEKKYIHCELQLIMSDEICNIDGVHIRISHIEIDDINTSPEVLGSLNTLWNIFGGTTTDKYFRLLDSHVGIIYGDSITPERVLPILKRMARIGYCCDNVVYGIGSYTYNYVTRDTYGTAMKATLCKVAGETEPRILFKEPTGDIMKHSARGYLFVGVDNDGMWVSTHEVSEKTKNSKDNLLQPVFNNGKIVHETTIDQMRNRIRQYLKESKYYQSIGQ